MLKQALTTVALVALSAPAFAGGLAAPVEAPVVAVPVAPVVQPSADWSGFYAGLQAGTASFDANVAGDFVDTYEGGYYGLHAGYMHDFGRFVVGGELRYDDASNVTGETYTADGGDTMISARLRLGYDMGRVLPYLAVGAGQLSIIDGGSEYKDTGILYGAGVDYALTDRWLLGAEFTHHEFDDFDGTGQDISGNAVGVRASFRF